MQYLGGEQRKDGGKGKGKVYILRSVLALELSWLGLESFA
jgi:hypothetical protein